MNINILYKKLKIDVVFLFSAIMLICYFLFSRVLGSLYINPDKFRDYMFISEIFNGRIILHGATSGIENVLHGVLEYWFLYPFVVIAKDYVLLRNLIVVVNIGVLLFFILWLYKNFSGVFSFTTLLYIHHFFPIHFISPCHLAFVMALYCLLCRFILLNNLFGSFVCTFFLFQIDIANWILFFPYAFMCLKQRERKYLYASLFVIIYFLFYIVKMNYNNIFNLSFVIWDSSRGNYLSSHIPQIILPFLGLVICILYKKISKENNTPHVFLLDYLFVFSIFYVLVVVILNAKIPYFVIPISILVGYAAHIILYPVSKLQLQWPFILGIIIFVISQFNHLSLFSKIKTCNIPQRISVQTVNIPVEYFLNSTFIKRETNSNTCKDEGYNKIYEILLYSKFSKLTTHVKDKKFLLIPKLSSSLAPYYSVSPIVIARSIMTEQSNAFKNETQFKKVVEFKSTGYNLFSVASGKFKDEKNLYIPLRTCLHKGMTYYFYSLKEGLVGIDLEESYLHFNKVDNLTISRFRFNRKIQ